MNVNQVGPRLRTEVRRGREGARSAAGIPALRPALDRDRHTPEHCASASVIRRLIAASSNRKGPAQLERHPECSSSALFVANAAASRVLRSIPGACGAVSGHQPGARDDVRTGRWDVDQKIGAPPRSRRLFRVHYPPEHCPMTLAPPAAAPYLLWREARPPPSSSSA